MFWGLLRDSFVVNNYLLLSTESSMLTLLDPQERCFHQPTCIIPKYLNEWATFYNDLYYTTLQSLKLYDCDLALKCR